MFDERRGYRRHEVTYTDYADRVRRLTDEEIEWFEENVRNVLDILGTSIEVYVRDHERVNCDATACYCYTVAPVEFDEFITIDAYVVHDLYQIATDTHKRYLSAVYSGDEESITTIICHELAHRKYHRHDKRHRRLTDALIAKCA